MNNFFEGLQRVAYICGVGSLYRHPIPFGHIGKDVYLANKILCLWASRKEPCPHGGIIISLHEEFIEGNQFHKPSDIWHEIPKWAYHLVKGKETIYISSFSYYLLTHHDDPTSSIQRLPSPHNRAVIVKSIPNFTWAVELAPEYNWRGDLAVNDPTNKVYAELLPPQFLPHRL